MFVQELHPLPDPSRCCEQLEGLPYRLFLDSAARGTRLARYSFVTADPVAVVRAMDGQGDAIGEVRSHLAAHRVAPLPGLPPFQGGAAGLLSYEWGRSFERLPAPRHDDLALPDVVLGIYDWVLAWDHHASRAWLISIGMPETSSSVREARAAQRGAAVIERLRSTVGLKADTTTPARWARHGGPADVEPAPSYPVEIGSWHTSLGLRSSFTHAGYVDAVARVREYIFAGDIFQANLSQRFEAPLRESPWSLYQRLRTQNAAPFAAYVEFPEAMVLSASPERFLCVDERGRVETRPIKGTRPRGLGPEHDAALGVALTASAKDRAENLMIVDLMRNDLSRVCAPGTVRVPELFALERYATVHHLVSTVVGELMPGADALDLLRAAFPGGSITGAPKIRAMEIIAELEPSRRGVYCGSIGYWSVTGALDTSIAIRTAVVRGDHVYFSAGGGIVADSDPEQEYRETLDKARGMIDALQGSA